MIPARLPTRFVTVAAALAVVVAVIALSIRFWGVAEWPEWPECDSLIVAGQIARAPLKALFPLAG